LRRHRDEERVRLQHPAEGTQHYDGQTIEHRRSLPTRAQGTKGSNTIAQYGHVLTQCENRSPPGRAGAGPPGGRALAAPLGPEGVSSGGARLGSSSWPGRFSGEPPSRLGLSSARGAAEQWNVQPRPCTRASAGARPARSAAGCRLLASRLRRTGRPSGALQLRV